MKKHVLMLMIMIATTSSWAGGLRITDRAKFDDTRHERCSFNSSSEDRTVTFEKNIDLFDVAENPLNYTLVAKKDIEYKAIGLEKETSYHTYKDVLGFYHTDSTTYTRIRFIDEYNVERSVASWRLSYKSALAIKFWSCESENEGSAAVESISP